MFQKEQRDKWLIKLVTGSTEEIQNLLTAFKYITMLKCKKCVKKKIIGYKSTTKRYEMIIHLLKRLQNVTIG